MKCNAENASQFACVPLAALGACGVGSLPRFAQQPRQTFRIPHYSRKAPIAEVSLLAAATTVDAITTRQLLNRHARTPADYPFAQIPSEGKLRGGRAASRLRVGTRRSYHT